MRNLLLVLICALAAYGGYALWNTHREPLPRPRTVEEPPATLAPKEPLTVPKPEVAAVPIPEVPKLEPPPPMPVVPVKRLAPEGIYYVMQAFSMTTDSGVKGVPLGTKVTLIKDTGTVLRVTDGRHEFDARPEFLTNDLDVAAEGAAQKASQQAATAEWHRKQQTLAAANKERNADAFAATEQRVQEMKEEARIAAKARAQRMAEIRAQIASEEAAKSRTPITLTRQKHLDNQNEKIRQLHLELGRLGVTGASLERR